MAAGDDSAKQQPELLAEMSQHLNSNGEIYYFGRLKDCRAVFLCHAPNRDDPSRHKLAARPYDLDRPVRGGPPDQPAPRTTKWGS